MADAAAESEIRRIKNEKDYYKILSLERTATEAEIKKRYRKLALQLHPDKCTATGAEEAFKRISAAYACLSEAGTRRTYDVSGQDTDARGFGGGGGVSPVDLDDFFRSFMAAHGGGQGGVEPQFGSAGGPFVFHFNAAGGNPFAGAGGSPFFQQQRQQRQGPGRASAGQSAAARSSSSVGVWVVLGLLFIYVVWSFFSLVMTHWRRILLVSIIVGLTRYAPPQMRGNLRNFLVVVCLLVPSEYLGL